MSPLHSSEEQLLTLLGQVRALSIRLTYGLEGSESLPGGVLSVLRVLGGGEAQTVPQIARISGTSRQNIQTVVNRLKLGGFVELCPNPTNKRSPHVSLTKKGGGLIKSYYETEATVLSRMLAEIREPDLTTATDVLKQIRRLLISPSPAKDSNGGAASIWRRPRPKVLRPPEAIEHENTEEEALPLSLL